MSFISSKGSIKVFSAQEIASFKTGGAILRGCLNMLMPLAVPGVTTGELDQIAESYIREHGGTPAFKGYHGYPATLCTSVNEQCVHGIPGKRQLKDGDIVSLDCGVLYDGLNTDACVTVAVGSISKDAQKLLLVTQHALDRALEVLKAGIRVGDLSSAIQDVIEGGGCFAVTALTGHGLGANLHEYPDIPNVGKKGTGPVFPAGTVVAVEPIVSLSTQEVMDQSDGWTIVTADGSLSAHFEHTLLVTEDGCEVIA